MDASSLRELGQDLIAEGRWEKALGVFAEAVRRQPADHRSRLYAATCYEKLGEPERAVLVAHAAAEGLLRRDYLLSAIMACKLALALAPNEKRVKGTLRRVYARAARATQGRARVPPPLPPSELFEDQVKQDIMGLSGSQLMDRAIEVLANPDESGTGADPEARPPLPLFAELDEEAFIALVALMGLRHCAPNETISTEGEGGDTITVMVAGKAEVTRLIDAKPKTLAFLAGGSIFGELSLLTGAPPSVTVTAVVDTEVFEIKREHLNTIARDFPTVTPALTQFAQTRMAKNLVATSPLFAQIPEKERMEILARFRFKPLQAGEKAITEGEHTPGLFMVLAGEVVVQKEDPNGGLVSLSILREGDLAGEISLLTGLRATATVVATRKTATAFMPRSEFDVLIEAEPAVKAFLQELSDKRLKRIGEALRPAEIIDADELVVET
jgi:CRP-like cAMP-binding protein